MVGGSRERRKRKRTVATRVSWRAHVRPRSSILQTPKALVALPWPYWKWPRRNYISTAQATDGDHHHDFSCILRQYVDFIVLASLLTSSQHCSTAARAASGCPRRPRRDAADAHWLGSNLLSCLMQLGVLRWCGLPPAGDAMIGVVKTISSATRPEHYPSRQSPIIVKSSKATVWSTASQDASAMQLLACGSVVICSSI